MESLWHKLQEEVSTFKTSTEEKRRVYNELLAKDKRGVAEVAENNKKIQKLLDDVGRLKETLAELGDVEEKRLSGLRAERDVLTRELHSTRRAVSVDYRNKEEVGLRKLAVQTDQVEKLLDEVCHRHEQMMRLSESCIKYETDEDDIVEARIASFVGLTDDEKAYLRRVDRLQVQDAPDINYLAPIQRKFNQCTVNLSALKKEHRQLTKENADLKDMMREYFKSLAASKDLAQLGLLSIQRKAPPHHPKRRRKVAVASRPKSSPTRRAMTESNERGFDKDFALVQRLR